MEIQTNLGVILVDTETNFLVDHYRDLMVKPADWFSCGVFCESDLEPYAYFHILTLEESDKLAYIPLIRSFQIFDLFGIEQIRFVMQHNRYYHNSYRYHMYAFHTPEDYITFKLIL